MRRPERVIGRLGPFGEAGQPALGAQCADAVAPPGQDLVGIALVADVPDQLVARRVEHGMQGDGQFHHPQPRAQMPAGHADGADGLGPHLVGQLAQFTVGQAADIGGQGHTVQERGLRSVGQGTLRVWRDESCAVLCAFMGRDNEPGPHCGAVPPAPCHRQCPPFVNAPSKPP